MLSSKKSPFLPVIVSADSIINLWWCYYQISKKISTWNTPNFWSCSVGAQKKGNTRKDVAAPTVGLELYYWHI